MAFFAEINEHPVRLTVFRFFEDDTASLTLHLEWKESGVSLFSIGFDAGPRVYRLLDWLLPSANHYGARVKGWCSRWT